MGVPQCVLLTFVLFILVAYCHDLNPEGNLKVKGQLSANNDSSSSSSSSTNNSVNAQVKEEQVEGTQGVVHEEDLVKSNVSEPFKGKDENALQVSGDRSSVGLKDEDKKQESGNKGGFGSKREPTNDGVHERTRSSTGVEKEKLRDEECDPSNMCVDEKKNLTACLRVPGNDSPDLSLLIQNKGISPVNVKITAPAFVQLEETNVQLQPKGDKKVKVSIALGGSDSLIFLTTEDSRCSLDFRELIPRDSQVEIHHAFKLTFFNNLTRTRRIILLTLTSFLLFGCVWIYFGLRKKCFLRSGYQTVEMELPVSGMAKTVSETNDGWDNSWDDNWDDEEAPKTPTLPATPNLSSRGLASRRLSKEGWKD